MNEQHIIGLGFVNEIRSLIEKSRQIVNTVSTIELVTPENGYVYG
jgi:hypothetical protein